MLGLALSTNFALGLHARAPDSKTPRDAALAAGVLVGAGCAGCVYVTRAPGVVMRVQPGEAAETAVFRGAPGSTPAGCAVVAAQPVRQPAPEGLPTPPVRRLAGDVGRVYIAWDDGLFVFHEGKGRITAALVNLQGVPNLLCPDIGMAIQRSFFLSLF